MKVLLLIAAAGAALCLCVAGCNSESEPVASSEQPPATTTSDPETALRRAVKRALRDNFRVAGYVLAYNAVPRRASDSTRGPALAQMRRSAASARRNGVRFRSIGSALKIMDVDLEPSYRSATALVDQTARVVPYRGKRRLGRAIRSHERARVDLRRRGDQPAFVVWKVRVAK